MSIQTTYQYIVKTDGISSGKPRIDGHRITVQNIVIWYEQMGYSVDEIATQYDLTLSEIYAALAYYYDHQDEIHSSIAEDEAFAESVRQQTPSLLTEKLHERRN